MAISKTQNERPAIVALIDAVNADEQTLAQHTADIANLGQGLADEATARADGDDNLTRSLGETNAQLLTIAGNVDGLADDLADESAARLAGDTGLSQSLAATNLSVDNLDDSVDALELWRIGAEGILERIKVGETETLTIPANDSYSGSYTFEVPYAATDDCIIMLQVMTSDDLTLFDVTLTDCTYSGFGYEITNSDKDPHDVKLGFVAFRTNEN